MSAQPIDHEPAAPPAPPSEAELRRHAAGRPLDATRAEAIRAATLDLLAEVGYDRLTIEAVAARAHAGKATVYRRWPSKAELVMDAVVCRVPPLEEPPDTGSLRGDLYALVAHKFEKLQATELQQMLGLVSALPRSAELQSAFRERFIAPGQCHIAAIFRRAVERGEIPAGRDHEVVRFILPALAFHRLFLTGQLPDEQYARTVIDQVLVPLLTAPDPR